MISSGMDEIEFLNTKDMLEDFLLPNNLYLSKQFKY